MQGHYGSLAADTTGHSLNLQYWHDRQPIQVSSNTPLIIRNSDILDQDFSWNQIAAALLQMSPRKAPGDDGITTAFYQAALYMPANTQEGVPPTPFARALLRVCGQVFASATIPRAWLCASIVSIDKKDGDPLNPGNKRDIALINVGLKLVCKVLQMRIERFVETKTTCYPTNRLGSQARRVCWTSSLICRHHSAQTECWAKPMFYSSISERHLIQSRWCTVMEAAEHGIPSSYSCLSQGIVHIIICSSTGRITTIRPIPVQRDDVAVFADSEQSLLAVSTAVEQWANRWEMQFGVAKCGIISFTGHLVSRLDNPLDIRLHGQLWSWAKPTMGLSWLVATSHTSHRCKQQSTRVSDCSLVSRPSTAIGPLLVETGIGSLLTRSLVSRVRLLERSVTKRTPINAICSGTDNDVFTLNVQGQLVRSQCWFWSRRIKQLYRNRYWPTPQVRPKTVKQRHSFALMETLFRGLDLTLPSREVVLSFS
ncbi:hypothetical protein BASA81_014636 [Batrachochytrium salamandrivorans]|nr:hypothetical protein BASA81_014636 [Batrachochytrium salamandrivorans]